MEKERAGAARLRVFRQRRHRRVASRTLRSADELRVRRRGPHEPLRDDRGRRASARKELRSSGTRPSDRTPETPMKLAPWLIFAPIAASGNAFAQNYPAKPIRFIVGPGPDALARVIGQQITQAWGQPVIIDQRGGGGGRSRPRRWRRRRPTATRCFSRRERTRSIRAYTSFPTTWCA